MYSVVMSKGKPLCCELRTNHIWKLHMHRHVRTQKPSLNRVQKSTIESCMCVCVPTLLDRLIVFHSVCVCVCVCVCVLACLYKGMLYDGIHVHLRNNAGMCTCKHTRVCAYPRTVFEQNKTL